MLNKLTNREIFSFLMINNKSTLWHLSNGIYLFIVSRYLYLQ